MIASAQMDSNGEVIGKSLKQIYSQLNGKKQKQLFEKYMMLELNIERENAGVDKIFENMSKIESRKLADGLLKKNPKFKEIANDLQRYNNNLLNMLVDGGVINEELSNKLKTRYKFYMPIYSSELSTFADLNSDKYFKNMKVNDTIQDVTKSGKHIQTLEKSLENKTYNVLSAIAKNKLANEMALSNNYESDGKGEMIYYSNGQPMKIKTSNDIIADISNNSLSHIADQINQIPVLKQMIAASNLSYRFILDPIYQVKNVLIDFTDSQLIYSKDKKNFAKNYARAAIAIANNSEVFNEFKEIGLADLGTGWKAPKVTYDKDGNVSYNQNKFQRIFANLEAMPKLAEYLSLKDRYMKQNMKDYKSGKYNVVDNHLEFNDDENYAIKQWSGTDSYIINQHYRDGTNIDDRTQKVADNMDSVLNKMKSESGTFNRSIILEGDKLQDFIRKYQKGKIVTEDAFTSMSKDIVYDDSFNVQMEIKSNNAKDTTKLMRADENEFMLKRGSQFRVDDVEINGGNVKLKLTDVTKDLTTIYKDNISMNDIQEQAKLRAKIDAQDVNLNFNSGGTLSKALSKSGFKFLNAGMLGFDKFVTHVGEGIKTPKGMGSLLFEFTSVGLATALANQLLNGDDEDYDKVKAEVIKLLRMKYSLEIISEDPLDFKKIEY